MSRNRESENRLAWREWPLWWQRVATFWQRRHAIWQAMPWPWHPVDGDPDGERRHIGEHLYYCWQGTGWWTPDETYFIAGGIDLSPLSAVETYGDPCPTYPGRGMVINTGHVDADAGIPCPPIDDMVEDGGLPIEIHLVSESQDGETVTITLGGVEIEAEQLEGGALRVKRPGEGGA